jgi:transposase
VGAALVLPHANAEAMSLHLSEISRHVAAGAHAVVVLDGAGWHQTGGRPQVPGNVSLLRLPPYPPELNPQENIWQYLRQNQLSNRVFGRLRRQRRRVLHHLERPHGHAKPHPIYRNPNLDQNGHGVRHLV